MNKTITLHLYLSELIYDIRSRCETISQASQEQMQHADDIADVDNNIILRDIMSAIADVRAMLQDYLVDGTDVAHNDLISETKKIRSAEMTWGQGEQEDERDNTQTLILRMPMNYADSQTDSICTSCHDYIVNNAISSILTATTAVNLAQTYKQASLEAMQSLTSAVYARRRVQRTHRPSSTTDNKETRYE